jgi:F-type H+-transporting ATPase subunit a
MPEISILPDAFYIGGVNIGLSVVTAWCVIAIITLFLLLAQRRIRHMEEVPRGFQAVLELLVDAMHGFAVDKVGPVAESIASFVLTLMVYVCATTLVELLGFPPATEDINCTLALGLCAFGLVNVTALRVLGLRGRIKGLANPMPAVLPIRVLTDCIAPISMAIRLFSNVLVAGVIMKLIYAVAPIVLPAALSAYFNILHVGIQTFVFGMLSLMYVGEAIE